MDFYCSWGKETIIITFCVVALLLFISIRSSIRLHRLRNHPHKSRWGNIIFIISCFVPILILGTMLFSPIKIEVGNEGITIVRCIKNIFLPYDEITQIQKYKQPLGIRVCASGGVGGFVGLFENKKLGRYRAFVTDVHNTILIELNGKYYVLSCNDSENFILQIRNKICLKKE